MPSRRSHGRSHHGCTQCKQRRIKCDETRPSCHACSRKQLSCVFESYAPEPLLARPPSPTGPPLPMLELELLHHWHVATAPSLSDDQVVQDTMCNLVVQMGLSNPSLMNSVLAVAALHRAGSTAPEHRPPYTEAATKYHDTSLRLSTPLLKAITQQNCHTLFALSCLASIFIFAARGPRMHSTSPSMIDIVEAFKMIRGSASVVEYARPWIEAGPLRHLLHVGRRNQPVTLGHAAHTLRTKLESFARRLADESASNAACAAIRELAHLLRLYLGSGDPHAIMSWPVVVDPVIFDLMLANERLSLIALGFYAAALGVISEQWWLDGWSGLLNQLARERLTVADHVLFHADMRT